MKIFLTGGTGFIGGSIAVGLVRDGHVVRGLVRDDAKAEALRGLGVEPVRGDLDDRALLEGEARRADAVVNAASSDHRGAVEALVAGLEGSGKTLLHTSGSSVVSDTADGEPSAAVYDETTLPAPTEDKAARYALDAFVRDAAARGVRSSVLCNTLIYGHGLGVARDSVQIPRLVAEAKRSGVVKHVGRGKNVWSNVHVEDVVALYALALTKAKPGSFYFVENGEASYEAMAGALAEALRLEGPRGIAKEEATAIWGYEMATYALGSNSRVRGLAARAELGWAPRHGSVLDWIRAEVR